MKMALDGGTPTTLVPWGPFAPQGIAVDATSVYWADFQGPAAVLTVPVGGGTPTSLAPFPQVWGLALLNRFPRDHGAWVEGGSRLILEGSMAMRTAREPPDEDASDGEPDRGEGVGEVAFRPRE